MAAESQAAVELKSVERRLGELLALRGVSLALGLGETLAIFGANGAGKTTMLRIVATLLRASSGEASVLGFCLPDQAAEVRARTGLLAHEPLLYRPLSGRENLRFFARLYGVKDRERRIDELLGAMAMEARADDPVRNLSRGMVQRIAICRAVLHDPEVLLLDEPYSHLDAAAIGLAERLIGKQTGRTRLLVTHDVEQGLGEADQVLGLRDGQPLVSGVPVGLEAAAIRARLFGETRP